jgi:hypothetical protein
LCGRCNHPDFVLWTKIVPPKLGGKKYRIQVHQLFLILLVNSRQTLEFETGCNYFFSSGFKKINTKNQIDLPIFPAWFQEGIFVTKSRNGVVNSAHHIILLNHISDQMTPAELNSIANKWFDAFNNQNLEQLLSLYAENAQHYSPKLKIRQPETNGLIKGKTAMRAWWQDAFNRLPSLKYEVIRLTPFEDRVFMEYVRHVNGEEDLYVGEMLEVENGKIVASAVFHR